jgi:hypothetical protein
VNRARSIVILLLALLVAAAARAATGAPEQFTVTSTLDGKTVLPQRIPWLARPSLPPSQITEVDFLIDGKIRWIEHRSPYSYGDDGESLVTSWLSPGKHRFAVRALGAGGQAATDTTIARVLPAPDLPTALAGSWRREVDTSSLGPLPPGIQQPSGVYRITFDRRWIQSRFPDAFVPGSGPKASLNTGHGWLIDAAWTPGPTTLRVQGSVSFRVLHDTDQEGGWWCGRGVGAATYRWAVSGDTLTLALTGRDPCRYRKAIWAGTWTRAR